MSAFKPVKLVFPSSNFLTDHSKVVLPVVPEAFYSRSMHSRFGSGGNALDIEHSQGST